MSLYLKVAELILRDFGKPLTAIELTKIATINKKLQSKGKTPENSMRARLSEELRKNNLESIFQRVGQNRFALREWRLPEYLAPRFIKSIPAETLVCFSTTEEVFKNHQLNGVFPINSNISDLLKNLNKIKIVDRRIAEKDKELKQLVSYVILRSDDGRILSYIRGKYSSAHRTLLRGKHCIGFGGHVLRQDAEDLFGQNDSGVVNAARREVLEELKGFISAEYKIIGSIFDCTSSEGQKHFAIVVEGILPDNFDDTKYKKELSINGVKLLSELEIWENFHLYEYWSQLIIRKFLFRSKPKNLSSISPTNKPKNSKHIVLVGEIASGKTTILKTICNKHCYDYVSTRQCLVKILKIPDFENKNRHEFQEKAQRFIVSNSGPKRLAEEMVDNINPLKTTVFDGIRNIATIKELRKILQDECIIVYIDCPRDKALENYKKRAGEFFNLQDFIDAREHETEAELHSILEDADAILYNAGILENTIEIFSSWIANKNN